MKEVMQYRCDLCGSLHWDKIEAEKCEQSHVAPQQIIHADYTYCTNFRDNYPDRIVVEMSDGDTVSYQKYKYEYR